MQFSDVVSYELGIRIGFNGGNDVPIFRKNHNGQLYDFYHAKPSLEPELNIIVAVPFDNKKDIFYMKVFLGKHPGECDTNEEAKLFYIELDNCISNQNIVIGKEVTKKLEKIIESLEEGNFKL